MDSLFRLSLLAAFIAGMVALFAPCCITFLLPAYFANIFKEKKRIILMTFVYSLGIFTVMLPVVLGARAISAWFFSLHDQTYLIGGSFLIAVAFMALLGVKLPMPKISTARQADDPVSTYIMGVFSGVTSACCAPVLVGVMTLSALTPTMLQALLVGFFYVLGMVTPLYFVSLFVDQKNFLGRPIFRKELIRLKLGKKEYPVLLTNAISFVMFLGIGLVTIFLTLSGRLSMQMAEDQVAGVIQRVAVTVTQTVSNLPGLDLIFSLLVAYLLYRFVKRVFS